MKYEIKNRFSGEIQFIAEIDCDENTEKSIKIGLAVKWAIENKANLSEANLYKADLYKANLYKANLSEADLDYSCLPLSCKSLKAGFDDKQIKQLLYHVLSVVKNSNNVSDKMKKNLMTKKLLKIANESHLIYKHDCEELK